MRFFKRSPKAQAVNVDSISRETVAKAARQASPQGITAGSHVRNGIWEQVVDPRVLVLATHNNWMLGTAIDKIIQEATKEGYEWVPKWAARCRECGKVYKDTAPKKCKECGNTEHWAYPDESQLEAIENVFQHPNQDENGDVHKSFMDIVRDCIFYLETVDDYYVEVVRDELGYVVELWPVASEFIRKKADNRYEKNFRERFCPICGEVESGTFARCKDDFGQHPLTIDTDYIQLGGFTNDVVSRWGSASLLHGNARAWGTRVYGVPKLYRVWAATQILRWMELYQWSAYSENKMPDSFVAFPGMKQSEVNDMVEQVVDFKEKNPHIRKDVFLGVQAEPKHVVTMPDFKSLMSVEMAQFLREAIAINYGVSLNMLGLQTPGKLGNETETVEVSYDTIDECQSQFNEFVNHKMVAMWPEVQDWEWKLISPKKDDLLRLATLNQTKAGTVATLRASGIDAYLDDDWDIIIRESPAPQQQQQQNPFGGNSSEQPEQEIEQNPYKILQKSRTYIKNPRDAPEGSYVQRGPKGGYYYEESPPQDKKPESTTSNRLSLTTNTPKDFNKNVENLYKEQNVEDWQGDYLSELKFRGYFGNPQSFRVNNTLRNGETPDQRTKETIDNMNAGLEKHGLTIPEGTIVYRGVSGEFAEQILKMQDGESFKDMGWVSTTGVKSYTTRFGNVVMSIKPKKGSNIKALIYKNESEVLLSPGKEFHILSKKTVGKQTIIEVEVSDD